MHMICICKCSPFHVGNNSRCFGIMFTVNVIKKLRLFYSCIVGLVTEFIGAYTVHFI